MQKTQNQMFMLWNGKNPSKGMGGEEYSKCKVTSSYDLPKDGKWATQSKNGHYKVRVGIKLQACHRIIRASLFLRIIKFFKHKVFINIFE